jgi:hypothetical protein
MPDLSRFQVFLSNWSSKAPQKRCTTRPCRKGFSEKIMKEIDENPKPVFSVVFYHVSGEGAERKKNESPCTCAEPIQKAPTHHIFFFSTCRTAFTKNRPKSKTDLPVVFNHVLGRLAVRRV